MRNLDITREAFNSKQACKLVGITIRQLNYWDTKGIAKPSLSPATGKGSRRLYSYSDLLALETVKSLRDSGISLQKVRKCIQYLRKNLPDVSEPLKYCVLLTDGQTVYLVKSPQEMIDTVKKPGQFSWIQVNLEAIDTVMRQQVKELVAPRVETVSVGEYMYQVQIEPDPEGGGCVAEVAGLPGCLTQGDTVEQVLQNAKDAIEVWLEAEQALKEKGLQVREERRPGTKATA